MIGIVAFGGYVPRSRLQRQTVFAATGWFNPGLAVLANGERAIASWDEDAITMGVEAARDCLGSRDRSEIGRVYLASTSLPNADRQNSTILKEALNLSDDVAALDVTGSRRAGTSALVDAFYAVAGGGSKAALCIASERSITRAGSEAELVSAHAAAAMLIGQDEIAARFLAGHSTTIDFVDHFRAEGERFDYQWEQRWVREEGYGRIVPATARRALEKCGVQAREIAHFLMAAPLQGINVAVARAIGIAPEAVVNVLGESLGDAGTAQPLVLLSHTLERAGVGEKILMVGFGGGCDALVLETTELLPKAKPAMGIRGALDNRRVETSYIRYLASCGLIELDRGMRAELDQKPILTALYRERKTVLGLIGGRCRKTGTVQFPRSLISVASDTRSVGTQEDYPLAERQAKVVSYTADSLTYTPDPPAYYGAIEFEGGGRLSTEFVDIECGQLKVGLPVRMVFRIKAVDERRGFTKYFWKAAPDNGRTDPCAASGA
jgi:hydroxymethylglutaryl-CoA synthase